MEETEGNMELTREKENLFVKQKKMQKAQRKQPTIKKLETCINKIAPKTQLRERNKTDKTNTHRVSRMKSRTKESENNERKDTERNDQTGIRKGETSKRPLPKKPNKQLDEKGKDEEIASATKEKQIEKVRVIQKVATQKESKAKKAYVWAYVEATC